MILYFMASHNDIDGVMVSVLGSGVVGREYKPQSGQTKDYGIGIFCFFDKYAAIKRKS